MAQKDQIDDPTGGDFNAALEESIQLVSDKQLDAAKNKGGRIRAFLLD